MKLKLRSRCIPVMELGGGGGETMMMMMSPVFTVINSLLYIYRRRGGPATIYKSSPPHLAGTSRLIFLDMQRTRPGNGSLEPELTSLGN